MKITDVKAIQILDSRGNPTLKVSVCVDDKYWGDFSVPSGVSAGVHEALELRDGKKAYGGLGVEKALQNVLTELKEATIGMDPLNQAAIDKTMIDLDGTKNKSRLGGNAILGVSGAVTRASAVALGVPLYQYLREIYENEGHWQQELNLPKSSYVYPKMYFNVLEGGEHAENNVDMQETMIVPQKDTISENIRIASEVYHSLKNELKSTYRNFGLGDEGGFSPSLESNTKALDCVVEAIKRAGYKPGKDVAIAIDVAASEIFSHEKEDKYILGSENVSLSSHQMVAWYRELINTYPIVSIEDGLSEDDWDGWALLTEKIGSKVQLVGDDLFVTNIQRIQQGVDLKVANAVLIKVNQIGSVTETFEAIRLATKSGYKCMISHRGGETADTFVADLVIATGVGQIKAGAPARGERVAKYNRLLEIEKELSANL